MNKYTPMMRIASAVLLLCSVSLGAIAQEKMKDMKDMKMKDSKMMQDKMMDHMMMPSVQEAFLKQSMGIEKKVVSLAEAVPQDKYSWRPMEGVRSVAESFLHAAVGNYVMLSKMGGMMPKGMNPMQLEKSTTDKKEIVDIVKKSFAALNECVKNIKNDELSKEVDFFGNKMTMMDMIMAAANHQHETLGQEIAYARTNHVVPPWSKKM